MTAPRAHTGDERAARATVMRIAEPGDEVMGHLLDRIGAVEVVRRLRECPDARDLARDLTAGLPAAQAAASIAAAWSRGARGTAVAAGGAAMTALPGGAGPTGGEEGEECAGRLHPGGGAEAAGRLRVVGGGEAAGGREPGAGGEAAGGSGPAGGGEGTGRAARGGSRGEHTEYPECEGACGDARGERTAAAFAGWRTSTVRLLEAWRARLATADPEADLAEGERLGARLIVPGDVEWPTQLDDLGAARPYGLWLHGDADLRFSCLRSVAIVGSRAATAYGTHVAAEFGASLGDAGWTVVSGGAYGIDGAAHRGAVAGPSPTVVVLACGTDIDYPLGHHDLFRLVRRNGLLVSECPPGVRPTRLRFLVRNRLIAALSRGTIVVEAALRSGALNTAGHAETLCRPVGAVPGPVTSAASAGCHQLIRQGKAVCVTTAAEVVELVGAIGDDLAPRRRGPVLPRDLLSEPMRRVLEAVPARTGTGPAAIAVEAGVDLSTALSCLGGLAAAGYVERTGRGWRLRRTTAR